MLLVKASIAQNLDDPQQLRAALQTAIELEHSTIPPYLYALYSLKPGKNEQIAALIQEIAIEEMVHMALACNILNAIGGHPVIGVPGFLPTYPGPLPGTVDAGLTVGLAPFSRQVVHDVFMEIESPEDPLNFPVKLQLVGTPEDARLTIGEFYQKIAKALADQPALFDHGDPSLQVNQWGVQGVYSLNDALTAINFIVEQGEGTDTTPVDQEDQLAHYYRFAEIYHGRQLVPTPAGVLAAPAGAPEPFDPGYSYSGEPIPFDPDGVWPAAINPKASDYAPGSPARIACDTFNYTYTGLLKALDATFNGSPDSLGTAIGSMMSLRGQALALMSTLVNPLSGLHQTAGPSFEYLDTLPLPATAPVAPAG